MSEPLNPDPADLIESATHLVIDGDLGTARTTLSEVDQEALWDEKALRYADVRAAVARREHTAGDDRPFVEKSQRVPGPSSDLTQVIFARDHYICRYCGRRTISLDVLRVLSRTLPDVLPFHPNWKEPDCHPVYPTLSVSLEHVLPRSRGGDNSAANLIAACACCNYPKRDRTMEVLGWTLRPEPAEAEHWNGLAEHLPNLLAAADALGSRNGGKRSAAVGTPVADSRPTRRSPGSMIPAGELTPGNHVRVAVDGQKLHGTFRFVSIDAGLLRLRLMWRKDGIWRESPNCREVPVADDPQVTLLASEGPRAGDPVDG